MPSRLQWRQERRQVMRCNSSSRSSSSSGSRLRLARQSSWRTTSSVSGLPRLPRHRQRRSNWQPPSSRVGHPPAPRAALLLQRQRPGPQQTARPRRARMQPGSGRRPRRGGPGAQSCSRHRRLPGGAASPMQTVLCRHLTAGCPQMAWWLHSANRTTRRRTRSCSCSARWSAPSCARYSDCVAGHWSKAATPPLPLSQRHAPCSCPLCHVPALVRNPQRPTLVVQLLGGLSKAKDTINPVSAHIMSAAATLGCGRKMVQIIVERIAQEPELGRRVGMLYVVDSVLQGSQKSRAGDSSATSCAAIFRNTIGAALPSLVNAVAKSREGRHRAYHVLGIWGARDLLPAKVLEPVASKLAADIAADEATPSDPNMMAMERDRHAPMTFELSGSSGTALRIRLKPEDDEELRQRASATPPLVRAEYAWLSAAKQDRAYSESPPPVAPGQDPREIGPNHPGPAMASGMDQADMDMASPLHPPPAPVHEMHLSPARQLPWAPRHEPSYISPVAAESASQLRGSSGTQQWYSPEYAYSPSRSLEDALMGRTSEQKAPPPWQQAQQPAAGGLPMPWHGGGAGAPVQQFSQQPPQPHHPQQQVLQHPQLQRHIHQPLPPQQRPPPQMQQQWQPRPPPPQQHAATQSGVCETMRAPPPDVAAASAAQQQGSYAPPHMHSVHQQPLRPPVQQPPPQHWQQQQQWQPQPQPRPRLPPSQQQQQQLDAAVAFAQAALQQHNAGVLQPPLPEEPPPLPDEDAPPPMPEDAPPPTDADIMDFPPSPSSDMQPPLPPE